MVRKNSGKWRLCVDFTNLNKACPKDAYPLPYINKLVDNASGFKSLSFMDAYSSYNQILMHPEDQSKTAFITEHGNFCYRVMPFGLKNTGATYQRLMDKSHTVIVRTNQPLRQILTKPELAGRLTKWSIELSEFDIQFQSRSALKSQILADFVSELTPDEHQHSQTWELHVDGALNREGSGGGIVLKEGDTVMTEQSLQFHFSTSNNQAKYEVLIAGLKLTLSLQENSREKNIRADILSKLAVTRASTQTSALSQLTLKKPSIESLCIMSITHTDDWRIPYLEYINTSIILRYETNPQNFKRKASLFTTVAGELYRRGFSHPLLKCLSKNEANKVMNKIHESVCGNHIGGRALAAKIIRTGYYWLTMKRDCITKVKTCDNCQKHATISMRPAEVMHSMEIEAQPLARVTAEKVRSFIWKNIICRFGIPKEIISNNGRQFTDNKLASFLKSFNIQHHFSSVKHPQTNGQAEAANRVILQAMRKKLSDAKGEWVKLIPEILWSYNTTIQSITGETPFKLVYESEALIPIEVGVPTLRTKLYNQQHNASIGNTELDLAEEDRDIAVIKQSAMKQIIERRHNKKVVSRTLDVGNLILR
ncbi:uncharacterized protein LOC127745436 [Arachis duranensis]|uniref:Uncharacterized protein LOC127745436 n=1 Tax=Arachis duranensis TaxID=130453 RepID=A0A9C6THA8_ARADU|nr:uncharacterized protein LOC127745436 [Arachis duranensis]